MMQITMTQRMKIHAGAVALATALAGGCAAYGQSYPGPPAYPTTPGVPPSRVQQTPHGPATDPMEVSSGTIEKLNLNRNSERQRRLVSDTQKLLELATALKSDVDKTDKNILSIDVVKRAEEIEKLAKSVKERMKGA